MYESLTFCANINNVSIPYSDVTSWDIIGSNYEYGDSILSQTRVTPIQWPDPPLLDTLWQGAKNYILKPAASALAGFLTGGPAGAAVAGATHIAHQMVTDLSKSNTPQKPVKVLRLPAGSTHSENTKTSQHISKSETKDPVHSGTGGALRGRAMDGGNKSVETSMSGEDVTPSPVPEPMKALSTPDESLVNE